MFIPEDGTGLSTANSYTTTDFATAYFTDRGVTAWAAALPADQQSALIRATDYMETRFGAVYLEVEAFPGIQALQFPRIMIHTAPVSPVAIPVNLQKAACEYALRALSNPLAPDPVIDPSGFKVEKTHEKVGPIEEDITYATSGPDSSQMLLRPYPAADMLLRGLIRSSQGRVIRN